MPHRRVLHWATITIALALPAVAVMLAGCPANPPPPNDNINDNGNVNGNDNSPEDSDGDGVADAADDCPGTPEGAAVDADGCAASQLDSDGDGVTDDVDVCPDTPAGAEVDEVGCPDAEVDTDGDGVVDADDDCPGTPEGAAVDANGCAAGQLDSDEDGVTDDIDECPDTPVGAEVDEVGCPNPDADTDGDGVNDDLDLCPDTDEGAEVNGDGCASNQLDSDGDKVTDDMDDCPGTPPGTPVDRFGCPVSPPPDAECGNNVVEPGEQCDPPDGISCDDDCQLIPGDNDSCSSPETVTDGPNSYDNFGATTDGPQETGLCAVVDVSSDVWFCYEASCSGFVTFNLCASTYDTTMAVYDGCNCPTVPAVDCSDDNCEFGLGSLVSIPAQLGQAFLVRVGGFADAQGQAVWPFCAVTNRRVPVRFAGATPIHVSRSTTRPAAATRVAAGPSAPWIRSAVNPNGTTCAWERPPASAAGASRLARAAAPRPATFRTPNLAAATRPAARAFVRETPSAALWSGMSSVPSRERSAPRAVSINAVPVPTWVAWPGAAPPCLTHETSFRRGRV